MDPRPVCSRSGHRLCWDKRSNLCTCCLGNSWVDHHRKVHLCNLHQALQNRVPHKYRSNPGLHRPFRSSMMCYTWYNRVHKGTSPVHPAHHNNLENDPTGLLKFEIQKITPFAFFISNIFIPISGKISNPSSNSIYK